ncbi:hypothetical protein Ade02nite_78950 [Paractinoplanes deccanensis]|uniref:SUKH-4 immunity protein of toxin-antitoxin system n=1 Tax=Paractinoplanes deccanensis TaxID=113561 RepID=A0ABQ3YGX1_9ACTN|nr:SUKH-4 family immunity protein [Actinoplanes deccanensis]GID79254.1 hypothetical protein Ade02nite_78950 [Actinoplanes deccanensis]
MTDHDDPIRYSPGYLGCVKDDAARAYLLESGIPRVADFIEDGPAGVEPSGAHPGFLLLGYVGDPADGFAVECETGAVYCLAGSRRFFANSSPEQFVRSFRAYLDVTYGELAGDDEQVEQRLRSELRAIDPATVEDENSFWNDTLGDVSMGVYGDDDSE